MSAAAVAVELIRKRGSVRTPAIAEALGMDEAAVDALLAPLSASGELNTCAVLTGGRWLVEYRCSASGGRLNLRATAPLKAPRPPVSDDMPSSLEYRATPPAPRHASAAPQEQSAAESSTRAATAPSRNSAQRNGEPARAADQPKGETAVAKFDKEKVAEIFRKGGPMTSRELKKYFGIEGAAEMLSLLAGKGEFGKLGGTPKNTIYGLPDQQLAERKIGTPAEDKADKAPRSIHAKKPVAKKRRKTAAKTARKAALKAWETRRKGAAPSKFRPALAADGAILLLGTKRGDFEIPREHARALVDLQRRLTVPELAGLVNFVTRLDNAEVGA